MENEQLLMEIREERIRLQDQRRELNKHTRSEARFKHLKEEMVKAINELPKLNNKKTYITQPEIVEGATLILSDIHYGMTVDSPFNYYSIDVCEERLNLVIDKTIEYCAAYGVTKLNVELCGDLVSGIIQTTGRVEQEEDIISQIIGVSELLSNAINKLAQHIKTVTVYCVGGNHSRVIADKKQSLEKENFERLVSEFIKHRVNGVKVIDAMGQDFIKYDDFGRTFVVTHGHNGKLHDLVDDYSKMFKEHVDCLHCGHWHEFKEMNDQDTELIVNGSLIGSDAYALSLHKNSKPMQVLKIYMEQDSITCKLYVD